jgi:hypothetical protein
MAVSSFSQKMLDSHSNIKLVMLYKDFEDYYGIYSDNEFWGRVENCKGELIESLTATQDDVITVMQNPTSIFTLHGYKI